MKSFFLHEHPLRQRLELKATATCVSCNKFTIID